MLVKIVKCRDKRLWYNNEIGWTKVVSARESTPEGEILWTREGGLYNYKNFLYADDAVVIVEAIDKLKG